MKKINLKAFKKDEAKLKHLTNVQGGSGYGSSTNILYTFCIQGDADNSWLSVDRDY